jgi:hypothetical protein
MMSRTDEPLEGVVFDVQDHARRTGTRGSVHMGRWLVRTSMGLKSPLDGRWDGRGRTGLWRALAQRRRRTPSSGRFGRDLAYGDQPLCRWDVDLDGQDVTRASWTFSGADSSVLGLLGTHSRLQEPPGSQRLAYWMMILP